MLQLIDTLADVTPAAPPGVCDLIIQILTALPAQPDQALATSWARVIAALPPDAWSQENIWNLEARSHGDHPALRTLIQGLAARYDTPIYEGLLAQARVGSLEVLNELGDVQAFPDDVVRPAVAHLSDLISQQVNDAHGRRYGSGGLDFGRMLALLNAWHPGHASWEPVYALLSDPAVAATQRIGAMHVLAAKASRLPDIVRSRLAPIALSAAENAGSAVMLLPDPGHSLSGIATHWA